MSKKTTLLPDNDVFDSDEKEVLINLDTALRNHVENRLKEGTEEYIKNALDARGVTDEVIGLNDRERAYLKLSNRVKSVRKIWDNNGFVPGVKDRIELKDLLKKDSEYKADWEKNKGMIDAVFSTDQPLIIPRVVEEMVREPVEPTIALTPLMQTINVSNAGTTISFPAIGDAMVAADIGDNGEYPEGSLELGGQVTAKIGKSGIAVKVSEDMLRYSMYDILGWHIRAAGRALVRHKERKVANLIFNNGTTVFDNDTAGYWTSGRGSDGTSNKAITADDFLIMYADMANEGFLPDTLIMHPLAWFAFARDPILRSLFLQGAGGGAYYRTFSGSVGNAPAWKANALNNSSVFGNSTSANVANTSEVSSTQLSPAFLPTPLRIIVTPFQTVDITNKTSTITLCDSSKLGLLLVDEAVTTDEYRDPMRDLMKIKFRERYGLALIDNGQAIRHAKKVNWWNKSYNFDDILSWQAGTGTLPTISGASVGIV